MAALQHKLVFNDTRLPKRPYCSNGFSYGLKIRPLETALKHTHIQLNPPGLAFWLVLDIDWMGAHLAWRDANLACPNWAAINPETGTAHLGWGLKTPVLTTEAARIAPLRYLTNIKRAYTGLAAADPGYAGLMTKNPTHEAWHTIWWHTHLYSLDELSEHVPTPTLNKYSRKSAEGEQPALGLERNVSLFDNIRYWAYREIRLFRGAGRRHYDVWHTHVREQVDKRNRGFTKPLEYSEVKAIAKSIAKWVWQQDPIAETRFREKQAERGRKGGAAKGLANENKRASARLMAAQGMSQRAIAADLGVSVGSVNTWVRQVVEN